MPSTSIRLQLLLCCVFKQLFVVLVFLLSSWIRFNISNFSIISMSNHKKRAATEVNLYARILWVIMRLNEIYSCIKLPHDFFYKFYVHQNLQIGLNQTFWGATKSSHTVITRRPLLFYNQVLPKWYIMVWSKITFYYHLFWPNMQRN